VAEVHSRFHPLCATSLTCIEGHEFQILLPLGKSWRLLPICPLIADLASRFRSLSADGHGPYLRVPAAISGRAWDRCGARYTASGRRIHRSVWSRRHECRLRSLALTCSLSWILPIVFLLFSVVSMLRQNFVEAGHSFFRTPFLSMPSHWSMASTIPPLAIASGTLSSLDPANHQAGPFRAPFKCCEIAGLRPI